MESQKIVLKQVRVETYSDCYFLDVARLIEKFHKEYLTDYYGGIEPSMLATAIGDFSGEKSKNGFLLIAKDKCVGLLAGMEYRSMINGQKFFHEIIWYVEQKYGRFGFYLVNQVKKMLKERGFSHIIMAVLENDKAEKIKRIYSRYNLKPLETHYIGAL